MGAAVPILAMGGAGLAAKGIGGLLHRGQPGGTGVAGPGHVAQELPNPAATGLQGIQNLTGVLGQQGSQLFNTAAPAYGQALNFYSGLMRDPRRMLAGPAEGIAGTYRGLTRGIAASTPPGGVRDQALAEARRDMAGQQGALYRDAPLAAAGGLGSLASGGLTAGLNATGGALGGFGSLLNYATNQQELALKDKAQHQQMLGGLGQGIGSLLGPILLSILTKGGGSGGSNGQ